MRSEMTEARFRAMCKQHDLTYMYADDNRAWREGCATMAAIYMAAKTLPDGVATKIWNEVATEKVGADNALKYQWDY